jgi:hypothetical protein
LRGTMTFAGSSSALRRRIRTSRRCFSSCWVLAD